MENIILSIIIPTYNMQECLKKNLDDILHYNKAGKLEVVVIDNNSTDKTSEIMKRYADKRIVYIRNDENIGMAPNWLKGLRYASGKYVMHLNDKDFFTCPEHLDRFIDYLSKETSGIIHLSRWLKKGEEFVVREGKHLFAYKCMHPTGFCFRREDYQCIPDEDMDLFFDKNNIYPYSIFMGRISLINPSRL